MKKVSNTYTHTHTYTDIKSQQWKITMWWYLWSENWSLCNERIVFMLWAKSMDSTKKIRINIRTTNIIQKVTYTENKKVKKTKTRSNNNPKKNANDDNICCGLKRIQSNRWTVTIKNSKRKAKYRNWKIKKKNV